MPVLGDRSFFDGPPPNFRYAHTHFALDALDSHAAAADDPNRDVPNPAKAHAAARVAAARAALTAAQTRHDTVIAELVAAARPGHPSVITNELRNQLTADVQAAEDELSDARRTARAIPARARLAQTAPDTMVLDTETKLITHAIRMAAYNSESALARLLHAHYPRAEDEGRALLREAFTTSGDIHLGNGTLHMRLNPLSAPRRTRALAALWQELTATRTRYPGTDLVLHYDVKPHP